MRARLYVHLKAFDGYEILFQNNSRSRIPDSNTGNEAL